MSATFDAAIAGARGARGTPVGDPSADSPRPEGELEFARVLSDARDLVLLGDPLAQGPEPGSPPVQAGVGLPGADPGPDPSLEPPAALEPLALEQVALQAEPSSGGLLRLVAARDEGDTSSQGSCAPAPGPVSGSAPPPSNEVSSDAEDDDESPTEALLPLDSAMWALLPFSAAPLPPRAAASLPAASDRRSGGPSLGSRSPVVAPPAGSDGTPRAPSSAASDSRPEAIASVPGAPVVLDAPHPGTPVELPPERAATPAVDDGEPGAAPTNAAAPGAIESPPPGPIERAAQDGPMEAASPDDADGPAVSSGSDATSTSAAPRPDRSIDTSAGSSSASEADREDPVEPTSTTAAREPADGPPGIDGPVEQAPAAEVAPARPSSTESTAGAPERAAAPEAGRVDTDRQAAASARQEAAERGVIRMTANGTAEAAVEVPDLGYVRVGAHRRGDALDVSIVVERVEAAVAIESARSALERELRQDGHRVAHVDVATSGASGGAAGDGARRSPAERDPGPSRVDLPSLEPRDGSKSAGAGSVQRRVRIVL